MGIFGALGGAFGSLGGATGGVAGSLPYRNPGGMVPGAPSQPIDDWFAQVDAGAPGTTGTPGGYDGSGINPGGATGEAIRRAREDYFRQYGGGPSAGGGQMWDEGSFVSRFGRPGTPQELIALEPQLQAAGIQVLRNAEGTAGKIKLPNGQIVDIINAAGAGGRGFQWLTGDGGGGGGGSLTSLYNFGSSMAPWTEGFKPPSYEDIQNDPQYKFMLEQGLQGVQRSAASKGTLLTGGTLKALSQYGQGLASDFADRAYGRGMGEYLLRRENFYNNQDRPFGKLSSLANLGRPV